MAHFGRVGPMFGLVDARFVVLEDLNWYICEDTIGLLDGYVPLKTLKCFFDIGYELFQFDGLLYRLKRHVYGSYFGFTARER